MIHGTMKVKASLLNQWYSRPHALFVCICIALVPLVESFPRNADAIKLVALAFAFVMLFFVGRRTDSTTAKVERGNVIMCIVLLLISVFQ